MPVNKRSSPSARYRRGDDVVIEVADNGRGISQADLEKVFDRLYRGASSGSSGVGLGLSIASSLTEAMGGRIEVESEVERGTTFRVILAATGSGH